MDSSFGLLVGLVRVVSGILRDSGVIGGDVAQYADLLDLGTTLAERGEETAAELSALKAQVEAIAERKKAGGMGPTDDECAEWRRRSDEAHAALQALRSDN